MSSQEIEIDTSWVFSAKIEKQDYGVPQSPEWTEAVDIEFESLMMFGQDWEYPDLVESFGQHGADGLIQHAREMLNPEGWE